MPCMDDTIASPELAIAEPLTVIDALFQARSGAGGPPEAAWGEREHFLRALGLDDEQSYAKVPCLNDMASTDFAKRLSLVRYRGLVQDIFEPEIYVAMLEEQDASTTPAPGTSRIITTKYRESIEPAPGKVLKDVGRDGLSQRGACYLVPLPGETPWACEASARQAAQSAPTPAVQEPPTGPSKKRSQPEDDVDMAGNDTATAKNGGGSGLCAPAFRRGRTAANGNAAPTTLGGMQNSDEFGLNFPLPWEEKRGSGASTACIVKLYDQDVDALRVCDTVEILGILCMHAEMANLCPSSGEVLGEDARSPSHSLVPRLHAISIRKLPFFHPLLPFTPDWLSEARLAAAYQANLSAPGAHAAARSAAVAQLARGLGGDMLATEYVLMMLASRSFAKHGDKPLGAWSLNLVRWPQGVDVSSFGQAVSELVPRAVLLPLNTQTLNTKKWRPVKDYQANRLVAGQLQLAHGTVLILDETGLAEGQVTAPGVKSLTAVGTIVTDHHLACDFAAYDVKIPVELSCILVSNGKSIVKLVDTVVPVQFEALPAQGESCRLDAARFLLGMITRSTKVLNIPEAVAAQISDDFAKIREMLQEVPPELCHTWMALARASCFSHGEDELTLERWSSVMQLEKQRLGRCKMQGVL
mmetsp:Transcript_12977/g.35317  ORF Transcript_12977/g.35317 Transcript_12977/m.35317 type:complete len:641 (-) Transcript_12977:166-2088(-)